MGFRRYFTTAMLCMTLLAGCSSGLAVDDQPTPTPITAPVPGGDNNTTGDKQPNPPTLEPHKFIDAQGLPFPVPSTEANPIITVSRDSAWGSNLNITTIPATIDGDYLLMLKAVAEDGKSLVGVAVPRDRTSSAAAKLVLMEVETRRITEIATKPNEYTGSNYAWATGASMDREWVVWREATTLQVYNIATDQRSEIKISNEYLNAPMRIGGTTALDHGIAVWAEGTSEKPEQDRIASVVKSVRIATGEITVLGRSGVNPGISWPTVIWIEPDLTTDPTQEGQVASRIVTLNLESGATLVLDGLYESDEVASYEDSVTWRGWSMGLIFLADFAQTSRQVIAPQYYSERQNLTLNKRLVAWDSSGGDVWDRQLGRLVMLNETYRTGTARVKGQTLAWQSVPDTNQQMGYGPDTLQPDDMTIHLLDTSQLSK